MSRFRVDGVFALVSLTTIAWGTGHPSSAAADWPMLGRDGTRNAVSPEAGAPTDWSAGELDPKTGLYSGGRHVLWSAKLGTQTFGDPVAAGGQIWVGTNNFSLFEPSQLDASILAGFSTTNGQPLYRYVSPRLPQGREYDWPHSAMAGAPLIEGERMWFVTNRCETVCLELGPLKRGEPEPRVAWKVDMMQQFGVKPCGSRMTLCHFCSIAEYRDLIYVITGNGVSENFTKVTAPEAPSVICFRKATGEVVWQDNSPGENILIGQWASPLVIAAGDHAQVVVPQGDGWLRSFDALTGELLWKFDINLKTSLFSLGGRSTRNTLLAAPVLYDGRVYVGSGQYAEMGEGVGRLVCLDPVRRGDLSTELAVDAAGQPLPQRRLQAVDVTKGERAIPNPSSGLLWEYTGADRNGNGKVEFEETYHRTYASVAIKDNLVMTADFAGQIHCLDAKSGKAHWTSDCFASVYAPPLIVEDKVYVADEDGEVAVFRLSAEPPESALAEINMGSSIYTAPIFANGVLYVATRSTLFAIAGAAVARKPPAESSAGNDVRR